MNIVKQNALNKIKESIVGGYTESFGVSHQVLFLEFRNNGFDYTFNIESKICFSENYLAIESLTPVENTLLFFNKINAKQIVDIYWHADSLAILFENELEIRISNEDEIGESWKFYNSVPSEDSERISIICIDSDHFAIW